MSPVTKLGLLCFEPVGMTPLADGDFAYLTEPTWIEILRNDAKFLNFVSLVVGTLELTSPPSSASGCPYCTLRDRLAA